MYDLNRTRYSNTIERPVPAGVEIAAEGLVLKSIIVGDSEHLKPTEGTTNEVIAGFSHNNTLSITNEIVIEDSLSIPDAGPYTVQLSYPNLVSGSVRVHDVAGAVDFTLGSVAAGSCTVNLTTGALTFAAADASKAIIVTYRRNLTVMEAQIKYRERPVNAPNPALFGGVVALCGNGELYTDQYDTSVSYDSVSTLYAAAGGIVTSVSSGKTAIPGSRIVKLPTAGSTFLGFRFNLA